MKKLLAFAVLVMTVSALTVRAQSNSIEEALKNGKFAGELGLFSKAYDPDDSDTYAVGVGYFDVSYKSDSFRGLSIGLSALVGDQVYEDATMLDIDGTGAQLVDAEFLYGGDGLGRLRDAYIEYICNNIGVKVGRFKLDAPEVIDGDVHKAVQVEINEIENVGITIAAFNEWIDNFSVANGISDREDVEDVDGIAPDAKNAVYLIAADITVVPDMLTLSPYYVLQEDAVSIYGAKACISQETEGFKVGLCIDYYETIEDVAGNVMEDADCYKLYASAAAQGLTVGLGYMKSENVDDAGDAFHVQGWVDDLAGLNGIGKLSALGAPVSHHRDDAETVWIDLGYVYKSLNIALQYGEQTRDGETAGADDYSEWSIALGYDISEALSASLLYVEVDSYADTDDDLLELGIAYKF